jgi:hypothetical protein
MALTDPQSVTISGVTTPLPRTSTSDNESEYTSADGLIQLTASHSYGKRERHVLRIDHGKLTADPFKPTENVRVGMSFYLVFDTPLAGYTDAEAKAVYVGMNTLYTASTHALIDRLLGGES